MEADAEREELARLRSLFAACDANRSGRLEREEFGSLCAELQVQPADAETIFQRLDADRDGAITFQEFVRGFRGANRGRRLDLRRRLELRRGVLERGLGIVGGPQLGDEEEDREEEAEGYYEEEEKEATAGEASGGPEGLGQAWQDFQARLGEEAKYIPRKEQVSVLYQNISLFEPRLIQPYEHVIRNFIREIKLQSTEMENLAIAVKRAQDKAAMQLSELEEEMDQRIQAAENKTKKEEKRKAEEALNDLKRQYEAEVGDLQMTIKKLKKLEEQSKNISQKEDMAALKKKIHDLSMENQKVRKDLLEAQTNIAFLQSELDALKSDYADQSLSSERDLEIIREYNEDRDSLERQIEMLQTANRKLHDSNDGLRTALENSFSKQNRSLRASSVSPVSVIARNSPKLHGGQSPQTLQSDRDSNEYDSEIECKPPKIFQPPQSAQQSVTGDASDTDTESSSRAGNVYQSCCVGVSQTRCTVVPEIRDEEAYGSNNTVIQNPNSPTTLLDWKPKGCFGSSTRKPISALSSQSDPEDGPPKYPSSEKTFKIVLAGDAAVGKSSFLMRLCKNEFRGNTSATLGVDFQIKTLVVDGEPTVLQLWDTAGQERFRSIAKSYFRRADGVLLLYDVTCEKSFLHVREWVEMIEDATHESIPIMIVGNKADLREATSTQEPKHVPINCGEKLAMAYNALFCETSAKDGSNIVEAVLHLAREVRKRTDDDTKSVTNLAGTSSKKSTQMKNCCNG
ncbi:ras and EF-hand domain-containing protein isoform X3 [Ornithorhynchus anatinus]|uniref:ras and EF-hand domain-containing protein isoform X3 n=1 Tax=Ornithorhynchus anatinus TaxID=9258 RepID=UPI0010A81E2D|nr:ras and EF-hand domain-containing protein isoform X3 [Ornithorhynchus anatinus]